MRITIMAQIQKVYLDTNHEGTVTCPKCHKSRRGNFASYHELHKVLNVKCGCGCAFGILIEQRTYYRKKTQLPGHYTVPGTNASGSMVVEDLSFTGIGFRTWGPHPLQVGDRVEVRFLLDNPRQSAICQTATVIRIQDRFIGAEFCDVKAYNTDLGFYLRPA